MDNPQVPSRQFSFSPVGLFLILAGTGILLSRLHVLPFSWSEIFWTALGAFGLSLVINAALRRRRNGVFFGSFLFFFSVLVLLRRSIWMDAAPFDWPANVFLLVGTSYLVLYLFDLRRLGILAAAILFVGIGALYYLWWMDVIDGFMVRHYIRTYWPVLLILMGLGVLLKRR